MEKEVLTLHLAEPWYSMIVSGQKTEEYRVIKPYWVARLFQNNSNVVDVKDLALCLAGRTDLLKGYINTQRIILKPYTTFSSLKAIRKVISHLSRRRLRASPSANRRKAYALISGLIRNFLSLNSNSYGMASL